MNSMKEIKKKVSAISRMVFLKMIVIDFRGPDLCSLVIVVVGHRQAPIL